MIDGFVPTIPPRHSALWRAGMEILSEKEKELPDSFESGISIGEACKREFQRGALSCKWDIGCVLGFAAAEFDNASRGEPRGFDYSNNLRKILERAVVMLEQNPEDYESINALYRAFQLGESAPLFDVYGSTMHYLRGYSDRLKNPSQLGYKEKSELGSFCIRLSREMRNMEIARSPLRLAS